jgi:hypothetical protein
MGKTATTSCKEWRVGVSVDRLNWRVNHKSMVESTRGMREFGGAPKLRTEVKEILTLLVNLKTL